MPSKFRHPYTDAVHTCGMAKHQRCHGSEIHAGLPLSSPQPTRTQRTPSLRDMRDTTEPSTVDAQVRDPRCRPANGTAINRSRGSVDQLGGLRRDLPPTATYRLTTGTARGWCVRRSSHTGLVG